MNVAFRQNQVGGPEFIPVGINCDVSHFLRQKGLRRNAYPFDWNVTPLESVCNLIEADFEGFLDPQNLVFLEPTQRLLFEEGGGGVVSMNEDIITPVVCRKYGMLFPHDFSKKGVDDFLEVRGKYLRRIKRFQGALQEATGIYVAACTPLNEWQKTKYKEAGVSLLKTDEASFVSNLARLKKLLRKKGRRDLCVISLSQLERELNASDKTPRNWWRYAWDLITK